jgi:hypothetical protein
MSASPADRKLRPSGAKAHGVLSATCGTTEVVPCYKTRALMGFSAACNAVPFQGIDLIRGSLEAVRAAEKIRRTIETTGLTCEGYWLTPLARKPPSTTRVCPVTKEAASEAR